MNILYESWRRVTKGRRRCQVLTDLVYRYSDSSRRYHTLEHIRDMLGALLATHQKDSVDLHRAIWWHDAVYDTTRQDNEERSADMARATLISWGAPEAEIKHVGVLIEVTKNHKALPGDLESQILIDLDLAILASPPEKYDFYALNVREEYSWVDPDAYRDGRSGFLRDMLAREQIFARHCPEDEQRAQTNMLRELARWQGLKPPR